MTPTHKDLVEALIEAKRGLEDIVKEYDIYDLQTEPGLGIASNMARSTLSKINPILNELEEGCSTTKPK